MAEPEYPVRKELETKLKLRWVDTNDYMATQRAIIQVEPTGAELELPRGKRGEKGNPGPAMQFQGIISNSSQLPRDLTSKDSGKAWVNTATRELVIWNVDKWFKVPNFAGVHASFQTISAWIEEAERLKGEPGREELWSQFSSRVAKLDMIHKDRLSKILNAARLGEETLEDAAHSGKESIRSAANNHLLSFADLRNQIMAYVYSQSEQNDASIYGVLANRNAQSRKFIEELSHHSISTHNAGAGLASFNTRELMVGEPYLYDDQTILTDDASHIVDGAQFFTMIRVGDRPGEWLDEYYGYVSGHGYGFTNNEAKRTVTWLVTAPSPYGPWTWREPVMGTRLGDATSRSYVVGPGCLAPDVMWVGNEIWLNYHGGKLTEPWVEDYDYANRWGAPSALAKSTDGINFVEDGIAIDIDRGVNDLSPYRASTSYRRTVRANGMWHTVWQGNTTNSNEQMGTGTAGYSVGHAVSHNGVDWKKQPPLLWPEAKGDQGPFSPSLTKVAGGWLLVVTYRRKVGTEQVGLPRMYFAEELRPGAFRSLGDLYLPERPGGREQRQIQSPFFFHHEGVLHMAYGNTPHSGVGVGIQLAKVGFR